MNFVQHNDTFFYVGEGVLAELTFKTLDDVEDFNRRYATARSEEEKGRVLRSIFTRVISTK